MTLLEAARQALEAYKKINDTGIKPSVMVDVQMAFYQLEQAISEAEKCESKYMKGVDLYDDIARRHGLIYANVPEFPECCSQIYNALNDAYQSGFKEGHFIATHPAPAVPEPTK